MTGTELIRDLGLDPARRVALLHADDVGMCHGANTSFIDLSRAGHLTCGSVMVPCAWFPEIGRIAAEDPSLDLGVHLTLTSGSRPTRWSGSGGHRGRARGPRRRCGRSPGTTGRAP